MSSIEPNGTMGYRVGRLEERVRELEAAKIEVIADRVSRQEDVVKDFRAQVRGEIAEVKKLVREENQTTRRALLGFILTIVAGVAVLALTFNFA